MKLHVWRKWAQSPAWRAWCGLLIYETQQESITTYTDLRKTTCLHCLRSLRDSSMWEAKEASARALEASEVLESVKAKAARKRGRTS